MPNFQAMQAYKGHETDANTKGMSMGSWKANLKKGGILYKKSGGSPGAKKLGGVRTCYPPTGGWKGGSPENNMGFGSPQPQEE